MSPGRIHGRVPQHDPDKTHSRRAHDVARTKLALLGYPTRPRAARPPRGCRDQAGFARTSAGVLARPPAWRPLTGHAINPKRRSRLRAAPATRGKEAPEPQRRAPPDLPGERASPPPDAYARSGRHAVARTSTGLAAAFAKTIMTAGWSSRSPRSQIWIAFPMYQRRAQVAIVPQTPHQPREAIDVPLAARGSSRAWPATCSRSRALRSPSRRRRRWPNRHVRCVCLPPWYLGAWCLCTAGYATRGVRARLVTGRGIVRQPSGRSRIA